MKKTKSASAIAPRRSREEWAAEVSRWRESGLGSAEYATAHGIRRTTLLWWSCQLGPEASPPRAKSRGTASVAFLPVRVREAERRPSESAARGQIEIVLRNGRRVRIAGEFDSAVLARVLEIAEGTHRC